MTKRIIFAYMGALGVPLILLPIAMINTMGGHSLMYVIVVSSPIGMIAALSYSDVKQQYADKAILARSVASLIVLIVSIALIAFLSDATTSPFLANQGWLLIIFIAPLITAATTNRILARDIKEKS